MVCLFIMSLLYIKFHFILVFMEHSSTVPKELNRIKPPPISSPSIKQNKIKTSDQTATLSASFSQTRIQFNKKMQKKKRKKIHYSISYRRKIKEKTKLQIKIKNNIYK